jgi:hypothetical protein
VNTYEIWVNLLPGVRDLEFCEAVKGFLGHLQALGKLESFRIRRRKLGWGPEALGEWNISIEFRDFAQIDAAFGEAATRTGEIERLHREVFTRVTDFRSAVYRDFPDPMRGQG